VARIYPKNAAANNEPEQRVLDRLRAELSDEWTVLHSLRLARHRLNRIGEADFVAFTNDCLVVVEVKGGDIACVDGEWYQNGNALKSPISQAWENFFALEEHLKAHGWTGLPGGALCIFPDGQFAPSRPNAISPSFEEFQCIGARDISMLGIAACIEAARTCYITRWEELRGDAPGLSATQLEFLLEILQPTLIALPLFDLKIAKDSQKLIEIDAKQYEFLTSINSPRILLNGPAGSGKTVLGYKACKNWLARNPGKSAAIVCSSTYLAKDLFRWVLKDGLSDKLSIYCVEVLMGVFWADTYRRKHDFEIIHTNCMRGDKGEVVAYAIGRPDGFVGMTIDESRYADFFKSCVEQGLVEIVTLPRLGDNLAEQDLADFNLNSAKDFIVVDEAQDFRNDPIALAFLNLRVKGGLNKGNVIWMQDLNQSVGRHDDHGVMEGTPAFAPEFHDYLRVELNKINYRNPYSIGVISSNLLDLSDRVESKGEGEIKKPIVLVPTDNDLPMRLNSSLLHLVEDGVNLRGVMIVSVTGKSADILSGAKGVYEFGLSYEADVYTSDSIDQLPEKTVRWSRLFDIKGREFPVIILIDLPDLSSETGRAQAYVASTRATSLLFILGEDAELSQWRSLFPKSKSG
jgi:hypothetical protein